MEATATARWDPKELVAPTLRYLQQPAQLLRGYNREHLRPDLIAGLTVGVVLLPQAIAFSLLAELPPQMGLYTAIVGGVVAALWGSSDQLHSGPTNALSLLILSTLVTTRTPGSADYIVAAGLLTLMVGVLQLVLGLLRLGFVVNFVSHSVIVGFATGAGALIALRQLGPLLGIRLSSDNVVDTLSSLAGQLTATDVITAGIGLGTMVVIILVRRFAPRLPGPLIGMTVAAIAVALLGERADGVAVIGALPRSLPPLTRLSVFELDTIAQLSTGALAVAAIGLVQTTAISRAVAGQTRQRLDSNQEFVGQGLASIFSALFSGYAVSGSFSCTAVNFRAGARTRVAAVVGSVFVLVAMLTVGFLGAYLPNAALAAVLIVTAYNMVDRPEIARILRGARGDAAIMVVTFLGTLFLDLDFAVLAGILLSFVLYVMRTSAPRVQVVVPDENFRHFAVRPGVQPCPQLGIVEILGDLYFGAVNHIEEEILRAAARHPEQRYLLIRMHHVNQIDFSGIHMLESVVRTYRDRGGDVYLMRVGEMTQQLLESTGCLTYIGPGNLLDDDIAIHHIFHHVLDPAICIYECPVRAFRECQNLPKRFELLDGAPAIQGVVASTGPRLDAPLIAPRELWRVLRLTSPSQHPAVLDVREPREYRRSHIAEAQSVPLSSLLKGGLTVANDRPIVLVCQAGRRSRRAAAVLRDLGYGDITVVEGGMQGWEAAGLLTAVEFDPEPPAGRV